MFSQNTKISILGLALSLSLVVTGCGPAFKSKNGKSPGSVLSKAKAAQTQNQMQNKTPEELAAEQIAQTNARLEREKEAQEALKDGFVGINENQNANFFVQGVKLERAGDDLVFSAFLKEKSSDNKGSVVLQAKVLMGEDNKSAAIDAANISVKNLDAAQSEVAPKPEEYSLRTKWAEMGSEVTVRLQRKGATAETAYAADFNFNITVADEKESVELATSSLTTQPQDLSYDAAVKSSVVEVETKENEEKAQDDAQAEPAAPVETVNKQVESGSQGPASASASAQATPSVATPATSAVPKVQAPTATTTVAAPKVDASQAAAPNTVVSKKVVAPKTATPKAVVKKVTAVSTLSEKTELEGALAAKIDELARTQQGRKDLTANLAANKKSYDQKKAAFDKKYEPKGYLGVFYASRTEERKRDQAELDKLQKIRIEYISQKDVLEVRTKRLETEIGNLKARIAKAK